MMPLSELSAGHIGRNGAAIETPPDSDTSDTGKRAGQFRTPSGVARTAALPTPSSVQSMLKNGTEIGDVGDLAFRSNRKTSSSQRLSPPSLSSSVPPSASRRTSRYRDEAHRTSNEHGMSHHLLTYHSLGTTNGGSASTFIYRNRSQTSAGTHHRGPSRGSEASDGRSYAMMQSASTSHNISRRPTHINGYLRSPGDPRGMRPRSPLVYPTRLKRPGYRPSSPSLTELYRSGSRSPFGVNRGTSFRTASPLSTYSAGGPPRRWPQGANRSDPVLAGHQLSLNVRNDNGQYFEAVARRQLEVPSTHTRLPTPTQAEARRTPSSTLQRRQAAPSSPPLFYDYSEQFQQELNYNIPLPHDISRTTHVLDQDYMRDRHQSSNDLVPDELLPVDTSMRRSRMSEFSNLGQVGYASATKVSEQGKIEHTIHLSWNVKDPNVELQNADTSIVHPSSSLEGLVINSKSVERSPMPQDLPDTIEDSTEHHILSSYRLSREDATAASEDHINKMNSVPFYQRSPSDSSDISAHESSNFKGRQVQPKIGGPLSAQRSGVAHQELCIPEADAPKFSFESERAYVKRLSHHENGFTTAPSFSSQISSRAPSQTNHGKIHSPVPRRSLSSPSHRSRFNSILSIDEGLGEPNERAATTRGSVRHSVSPIPVNLTPSIPISSRPGSPRHISGYRHGPPKMNGTADAIEAKPKTDVESKEDPNSYGMTYEVQAQDESAETQTIREIYMKATANEAHTPGAYQFKGQLAPERHKQLPIQVRSLLSDAITAVHHNDVAPAPSDKVVRTMKELPPLPRSSIVSVAPPAGPNATPLPFSFTALRPEGKEETDSVTELGKLAASYLDHLDRVGTQTPTSPHKFPSRAHSDKGSSPARPSSRPWNSEENYPWSDWKQQLKIAVPTPNPSDTDVIISTKAPRFKLKLHRSPASTAAVKITKPRPSDESTDGQRFSTSSDIFQTTPFGRKTRPTPLATKAPGQVNSSRASLTQLSTRFVESFDLPANDFMSQTAPSLTLVPPSPGLNLEARSFFSDDSSQMQPKGSLRKRFSQLKATVIRSSTSDDAKGGDRALLGSGVKPRGSRRNSPDNERGQQATENTHQNDTTKWRFVEKVKTWFLHLVARKT